MLKILAYEHGEIVRKVICSDLDSECPLILMPSLIINIHEHIYRKIIRETMARLFLICVFPFKGACFGVLNVL